MGRFAASVVLAACALAVTAVPVLVRSEFWAGLVDWIKDTLLQKNATISAKDLDLIQVVDTADEAVAILNKFYEDYLMKPNF